MDVSRIKAKYIEPGDILVRGAFDNTRRYEVLSVRKAPGGGICFKVQLVNPGDKGPRGPVDFWTMHAEGTTTVENS